MPFRVLLDDSLFSGGPAFKPVIEMTRTKFQSKLLVCDDLDFVGIRIETNLY